MSVRVCQNLVEPLPLNLDPLENNESPIIEKRLEFFWGKVQGGS